LMLINISSLFFNAMFFSLFANVSTVMGPSGHINEF